MSLDTWFKSNVLEYLTKAQLVFLFSALDSVFYSWVPHIKSAALRFLCSTVTLILYLPTSELGRKYATFVMWTNNHHRLVHGQGTLTLLPTGFLTNDYSGGGGSLGPRSYFQLIWTSFWTHGTNIDQLIVKGVNQWSCKKNFLRVPLKLPVL